MSWRDLGYSRKGGIIGGIISVIGIFLVLLLLFVFKLDAYALGPIFPLMMPFMAISLLLSFSGIFGCNPKSDSCYFELILGFILTIVVFMLIGMFIGWIVGKIKSR